MSKEINCCCSVLFFFSFLFFSIDEIIKSLCVTLRFHYRFAYMMLFSNLFAALHAVFLWLNISNIQFQLQFINSLTRKFVDKCNIFSFIFCFCFLLVLFCWFCFCLFVMKFSIFRIGNHAQMFHKTLFHRSLCISLLNFNLFCFFTIYNKWNIPT